MKHPCFFRFLTAILTVLLLIIFSLPSFALVFQYTYDGAGQLMRVQESQGNATIYAYDSAGNLHYIWNHLSDMDIDGMADSWENQYGLNVGVDDSANDPDADGLINIYEYLAGTTPFDSDYDDDLMPDGFEVQYDLNPLQDDAQGDVDSDGLSNLAEYQYGADPRDPDSEDDGMPDGWEVANFLNPLQDDASADRDGDGYTNLQEYNGGSDPNDPDSRPVVLIPMLQLLLLSE